MALKRAEEIGGGIVQIFVKNNMQWKGKGYLPEELRLYSCAREANKFSSVFGHTGYLINLGAGPSENREKSLQSLIQEIGFAAQLGLPFLVLHPGAHLGAGETAAHILGVPADKAPSLLFELVQAGQHLIPNNGVLVAFGVLIVGMITGIDGSGFAGLPLTGALSGALAPVVGMDAATLAAVGQMGAVWTGGGTLVAWSSLIAVTGFARVPVMEAVRLLLVPVIAGLVASTFCAVLLWG